MGEKRILTFRVDADLADRLDEYARTHGWTGAQAGLRGGDHKGRDTGRSALLVHVVEALVEDRVILRERSGSNAFPAEEKLAGESPEYPALIALGTSPR